MGDGFSIARKITAARAGSFESLTATDSNCAAVTPNAVRIESRWRALLTVSTGPMGSFLNATMVLMNVESLMSVKTGSREQAEAERAVVRAKTIRRFTIGKVDGRWQMPDVPNHTIRYLVCQT